MTGLVIDNFAGGGGASTGIEAALGRPVDFAINHDPQAIAMHRANHPRTTHLQTSVWDVDPHSLARGRRVGLGWFSPDCTFHSKARGGKPFRERNVARRRRGLAGIVPRWLSSAGMDVFMLENVEEFAHWGPLLSDGSICPKRRGMLFRRWHRQIENIVSRQTGLPYRIDMRELRACDYSAPTTRKRLFVIGRCDGQEIVFPEATHGEGRGLLPFRTAAECIDFTDLGHSIWLSPEDARKARVRRPLADATLRRIARGVIKYVLDTPHPFVVTLRGSEATHVGRAARSINEPLRCVSAQGTHHALVTPFLTEFANASGQRTFRADSPLRTQCANVKGGHFALVAPTLINTRNGERVGQDPRTRNILRPYGTVTAVGSQGALVATFLAKHYTDQGQRPGIPMHEPVSTITTQDHHSLVAAFLMKYYGEGCNVPGLSSPLDTITSKDRFGLVTVKIDGEPYCIVDIAMRMLKPRELYLAQSFPPDYVIDRDDVGNPFGIEAQVRMCGNSVPPAVAEALVRANVVEQREEAAA